MSATGVVVTLGVNFGAAARLADGATMGASFGTAAAGYGKIAGDGCCALVLLAGGCVDATGDVDVTLGANIDASARLGDGDTMGASFGKAAAALGNIVGGAAGVDAVVGGIVLLGLFAAIAAAGTHTAYENP